MAGTIKIRQYQATDIPVIHQLYESGWRTYTDMMPKEVLNHVIKEGLTTDLSDIHGTYISPGGNFWVATFTDENEREEQIVGIVGLEKKPDDGGELRRLAVHLEYRRYGVGRKLIAHLEQWATENKFSNIFLTTGAMFDQPVKFYHSMGYSITKTITIQEEPPVQVLMFVKDLHEN